MTGDKVFISSCTGQDQFTQASHGVHPTPTQISMALLTPHALWPIFICLGLKTLFLRYAADDPPDPGDSIDDTLLANTKRTRLHVIQCIQNHKVTNFLIVVAI